MQYLITKICLLFIYFAYEETKMVSSNNVTQIILLKLKDLYISNYYEL